MKSHLTGPPTTHANDAINNTLCVCLCPWNHIGAGNCEHRWMWYNDNKHTNKPLDSPMGWLCCCCVTVSLMMITLFLDVMIHIHVLLDSMIHNDECSILMMCDVRTLVESTYCFTFVWNNCYFENGVDKYFNPICSAQQSNVNSLCWLVSNFLWNLFPRCYWPKLDSRCYTSCV